MEVIVSLSGNQLYDKRAVTVGLANSLSGLTRRPERVRTMEVFSY
jgi:hypothetical protein